MVIEVELPDGNIAEFPDGTEASVIEGALAQQFAPSQPSQPQQMGSFQQFQTQEPEGAAGAFGAGLRQGAINIGGGVLRTFGELANTLGVEGAQKFLSDLEVSQGIEQLRTEQQTAEQPAAGFVGEVIGETAAFPIPGGAGQTLARKAATAAVSGATAGGVSAAGRFEDVADAALLGAGFGSGLQSLTSAGQNLARRFINAKGGQFRSADIAELVQTAKAQGIDLFADDAAASPLLAKLGILAEDVPLVGTRKGRLRQSGQQREAAERLASRLAGDIPDLGVEIQKGLQRRLSTVKKVVGKKFARAANALDPLGDIPRTNFLSQIDQEIAEEVAKGTRANQGVIDILESFKASPEGNFSAVRSQRSDLGDEISAFFTGDNKNIGAKGSDRLQRVKNALESDIEGFVDKSGSEEGLKLFRDANKFTVDNLIPFKETQLSNLVKSDEPEKIIAFLKASGGRQSRANRLFKSLDAKGRAAVKASLVNDALEKALPVSPTGVFSANKFAAELEKVQNATNTFFKGQDQAEINGLVKLMRATARAGQAAEQPPTGARLLLPGVGVAAVSSLGSTLAAVGGFGAASRFLFQSEAGKRLLLGLNRATPGTAGFDRVSQRVNDLLTRSAIVATQEESQ
jgi:hypothetical protein